MIFKSGPLLMLKMEYFMLLHTTCKNGNFKNSSQPAGCYSTITTNHHIDGVGRRGVRAKVH